MSDTTVKVGQPGVTQGKTASFAVEGDFLVLRMPMQQPKVSKKGTNMVVCTSNGFRPTNLFVGNKEIRVNVNAIVEV